MGWTIGQQAAIDQRNANILVSAAAGSGKTAVLTERVFQRVLGSESEAGIDIDRFLIVTFTSAAANEMKERIADKMSKEIEQLQSIEDEEHTNKIVYLEKQLSLLSKASISTIHSFCLKTVKNYFNNLDIDPNIRVGNESELHLMKLEILEDMLEEAFDEEDNEDFLKLADTYGSVRGMEALMELILEVHTFSKSTIFPNEWLDEQARQLCMPHEQMGESIWAKAIIQDMVYSLIDLEKIYNEALKLTKKTDGPALYEQTLQDDLAQIQAVTEDITIEDLDQYIGTEAEQIIRAIGKISFGRLPTKKQECSPELKDRVKSYRDLAKKVVEEVQYKTKILADRTLVEKTQKVGEIITSLVEWVKRFDQKFAMQKREKSLVDYNDLEHMCLQLLITKEYDEEGKLSIGYTDVAEELAGFYEEIYIDEYQDSNMVQETLLGAIAQAKEEGPTRFMVGDMKQSIYRFRLANPLIFAGKYNAFAKYETCMEPSEKRRDICIDLSQNFRSREGILAATNDLFEQVMSSQVGELEYDEDAKLKVGNDYAEGSLEQFQDQIADTVELHVVETEGVIEDESEDGEGNAENADLKAIELEAQMVAELISSLLRGEGNPQVVFDKELGDYRKVQPKDIVILLRSVTNKANLFEQALLERGVDAYADVSGGFFEAREVQTMLSMLQLLDNPRQDIPLLSVLRSPIVGLDFDEILVIRKYKEDVDFYTALTAYLEADKGSVALVKFYELLQNYREKTPLMPLEQLLANVYIDTGYYRYVGMLPAGAKKKANLKMLQKYAEEFENNVGIGLFQFLQHMERLRMTGSKVGEAKLVGENENLVRIMTIHKSKGLEFPIVFISNASKKFNNQDIMNNVLMHNTLGFGPKYTDPLTNVLYETVPFYAIKDAIVTENISEEMRVLYVALTRAKEKLYITGTIKNLAKQVEKWSQFAIRETKEILPLGLRKSPTYLNWIGMSLFAHKDFDMLRNTANMQAEYLFEGTSNWSVHPWNKARLQKEQNEIKAQIDTHQEILENWDSSEVHSEVKEEIYERLNYSYPHEAATVLPTKVAVSELKKREQEQVMDEKPLFVTMERELPSFMREEEQLKATTRGTIIHTVFEHLNLMTYTTKETIKAQLIQLIREGKIVEEAEALVDLDKLESIAHSEMLKRMREAEYVWKEKAFVYLTKASEVDEAYPEDEEILIQGVVDNCFLEKDGLVIVDYKTDYINPKAVEAGIEKIKSRYKIQLDLYGEAMSEVMKIPVKEKVLYLYSVNKWVKIE